MDREIGYREYVYLVTLIDRDMRENMNVVLWHNYRTTDNAKKDAVKYAEKITDKLWRVEKIETRIII